MSFYCTRVRAWNSCSVWHGRCFHKNKFANKVRLFFPMQWNIIGLEILHTAQLISSLTILTGLWWGNYQFFISGRLPAYQSQNNAKNVKNKNLAVLCGAVDPFKHLSGGIYGRRRLGYHQNLIKVQKNVLGDSCVGQNHHSHHWPEGLKRLWNWTSEGMKKTINQNYCRIENLILGCHREMKELNLLKRNFFD